MISWTVALEWLGIVSGVMFIGSLLIVPWLISRLPAQYFLFHRQVVEQSCRPHSILTVSLIVFRNMVGAILLAAGIAMLMLPGQGVLTILIGCSFMDIPGKHHLLEQLVRLSQVRKSLNWIRRKAGKEPFIFGDSGGVDG